VSCKSAKEPSIPAKEHYIYAKESNVSVKGPKIIGGKGQHICKSAPNICQRTLIVYNWALHDPRPSISGKECISAKEPDISTKQPYTSTKEPNISAKEP